MNKWNKSRTLSKEFFMIREQIKSICLEIYGIAGFIKKTLRDEISAPHLGGEFSGDEFS
jgi:hypothetical protein